MSDGSVDQKNARQALSELVDGELDSAGVGRTCAAWREDGGLRETWHAYHLIGDVLRSDDLASAGRHDAEFLDKLRGRLAKEPVVLAPERAADATPEAMPAQAAGAARRRWWPAPVAVAAGFMAVAGVLVVTRVAGPMGTGTSPSMVALTSAQAVASAPAIAEEPVEVTSVGPDARLVRDARLDRYLAAHKQYGSSAGVNVPGVMLRNATTFAPER